MLENLKKKLHEKKKAKINSICSELTDLKKDLIGEMNK